MLSLGVGNVIDRHGLYNIFVFVKAPKFKFKLLFQKTTFNLSMSDCLLDKQSNFLNYIQFRLR